MEELPEQEFAESHSGLWGFVKKTLGSFSGSVFSTVAYSASMVAVPFFLEQVIEAFKSRISPIVSIEDFFGTPEFQWSLAIGAAYTGFQGVSALRNYFIKRTAINMQALILPEILKKSVALTYTENQNLKKGEIDQNLGKLQGNLEAFFTSIIHGSSSCLELALAMVVIGIKFEYEFSLYLGGIALFNVGTMVGVGYLTRSLDNAKIKADEGLSFVVRDIVENYENIKVNSKEKYIMELFANPALEIWVHQNKRSNARVEGFAMAKDMFLGAFGAYIIARALYHLLTEPGRSIDDITYIVIYLRQIIGSSSAFDINLKKFMSSYRNLNSIINLLDKAVEVNLEQNVLPAPHATIERIVFENVRYKLGKVEPEEHWVVVGEDSDGESKPLVENVSELKETSQLGPLNFSLQLGSFMGIAGDSGSGKTVITRLLFRFLHVGPEQGSIAFNFSDNSLANVNIQVVALRKLRTQICYTPQSSSVFDTALKQNITLPEVGEIDDERYNLALDMAQFSEKEKNASPEEIKKFSGGQRQRMGLARAFYKYLGGCRIFIFDESTSALDATLQSKIMKEIYTMRDKGCMVIFVAHRLNTIRSADQILFLRKDAQFNRSIMELQQTEGGVSAFDALRKQSCHFNELVVAEFGEDLIINPGRSVSGMFSFRASQKAPDSVANSNHTYGNN